MNKELTPLEALYKLKSQIDEDTYFQYDNKELLCVIETALKELEEYKKCIDVDEAHFLSTHGVSVVDTETFNQLAKNSQVLEIIKKIVKIVDYSDHTIANGNLVILQGGEIKTKEEYDLYFSDTETAYAYELSNVVKFAVLKLLSDYGVDQAPQSFVYVNNGEE